MGKFSCLYCNFNVTYLIKVASAIILATVCIASRCYLHPQAQTNINTYIQSLLHAYLHAHTHTYCVRTYMNAWLHTCVCWLL